MSTWELGAGSWAPPERAGGRRPRYDVPAPRRLNGARHAGGAGKGGERAAGERPGGGGQRGKAGAGAGRAQTPASPEARQRRWQSCRKESRPGRAAEAQMAGRAPDRRVAWRLALGAQFTRARGQCRHLVSGRRARPADADTGAHRATHDNHRMPGRVNRRIPRIPQRAPSAAPTSRGGADAHEVCRLEHVPLWGESARTMRHRKWHSGTGEPDRGSPVLPARPGYPPWRNGRGHDR